MAVPAVAVALVVGACTDGSDNGTASGGPGSPTAAVETGQGETSCPSEGEPLEGEVKLYIEHNATDEDTGVHGTFEHEGLVDVHQNSGRHGDHARPAGEPAG